MIAGILLVVALAGPLFLALWLWCFGCVQEIPGARRDPVGDAVTAWWLAVAWLADWRHLLNRSW